MDVFGAGALLAGGGSGTITPSTSAWLSGLGTFTAPAAGVVDPPPREIVAGAVAATAHGSAAQGSSAQANVEGTGTEGRELGEEGREGGTWVSLRFLCSSLAHALTLILTQPHIYQPASASTPLSLPQVASPAAPPPPAGAQGVVITDAEVQGLVRLIHSSHASPWQHVAISSFPDAGTVRHCIDLYFRRCVALSFRRLLPPRLTFFACRRFHPSFPVLSQHRFERASEPPPAVLLLAVVAIGASFDPNMAIMVLPLAELCRRVILFLVGLVGRLAASVFADPSLTARIRPAALLRDPHHSSVAAVSRSRRILRLEEA